MTIEEFFAENPRAALGFSGGVDSAYLLYAALKCGADICAYYVKTAFQPAFEPEEARELADGLGARLTVLELGMPEDAVLQNPKDRCLLCKLNMFGAVKTAAAKDGYDIVMDGTNASDDAGDRPGMRALSVLGICSPLKECGLNKTDIRRLSHEAGLPTWVKPAYSCLATRIHTGTRISQQLLERIEGAESAVKAMGYTDIRVRTDGNGAVLRVHKAQLAQASCESEALRAAVSPFFADIVISDRESEKHG